MPYGKMRLKPISKFGEWLDMQMSTHNMSALEVAEELHCAYSAIYFHRSGRNNPSFSDVVAYCWLFDCKEDPVVIWNMAKIPVEEK